MYRDQLAGMSCHKSLNCVFYNFSNTECGLHWLQRGTMSSFITIKNPNTNAQKIMSVVLFITQGHFLGSKPLKGTIQATDTRTDSTTILGKHIMRF
ncbi:hypothetical protein TNIN_175231 [Trichonephila inaurata madagascariensis]|uniref:Uncharacterized protein n=1 Tax=Trichonephila inaurata madagascariensis TaxID=2747483 RepID=A0A8X7C7D4_9ARAC|nr:hypothetical protein TNIN_175231 [Trichonephila inaurata madagascariensis]